MQVQVNKFNFSEEEERAINERAFFLLKSSAAQKVMDLFGTMEREMKNRIAELNIDVKDLNISSGKIFRGENYKLYPYILLDYPRLFSKQSVFAFRSMFWWGHEFSFTLHLGGEALNQYRETLVKNFDLLKGKDAYFCINETPWQYDFNKTNYLPVEEINEISREVLNKPFIKLSRKLPVESHENVYDYSIETLLLFLSAIKSE
jgi:hypothetical protein